LFVAVVVAVTASVAGVLVNHYLKGSAELQVTLCQPIPNPQNDNQIQFMVIESTGSKAAREITVKVTYPISVQPFDYRIETLDPLSEETRTDSYLRFRIPRLTSGDYALIIFVVGTSEIEPEDVRIAHDECAIPAEEIKHVKITYFKE